MTEIIYQLHASGRLKVLEGAGEIVSGTLYSSEGRAREAVADFARRCCDDGLRALDPENIRVTVVPMTLVRE